MYECIIEYPADLRVHPYMRHADLGNGRYGRLRVGEPRVQYQTLTKTTIWDLGRASQESACSPLVKSWHRSPLTTIFTFSVHVAANILRVEPTLPAGARGGENATEWNVTHNGKPKRTSFRLVYPNPPIFLVSAS